MIDYCSVTLQSPSHAMAVNSSYTGDGNQNNNIRLLVHFNNTANHSVTVSVMVVNKFCLYREEGEATNMWSHDGCFVSLMHVSEVPYTRVPYTRVPYTKVPYRPLPKYPIHHSTLHESTLHQITLYTRVPYTKVPCTSKCGQAVGFIKKILVLKLYTASTIIFSLSLKTRFIELKSFSIISIIIIITIIISFYISAFSDNIFSE